MLTRCTVTIAPTTKQCNVGNRKELKSAMEMANQCFSSNVNEDMEHLLKVISLCIKHVQADASGRFFIFSISS